MSVIAPVSPAPYTPARAIALIAVALTLGYAVVLASALVSGHWLLNAQWQPIAADFVNVWAAGRLTLDGHPALAYDWIVHKSMEVRAVGHAFDNYYGWHYPPTFLFAASALALLPFTTAALLWLAATLPLYLATMRAILGGRSAYLLALGFPATLWNVVAGQNGFLTAGLIGGALALLERHPVLAGICIGLTSYKPHFALLFPFALAAGRHWRALVVAAAVALAMAALSLIVHGPGTWIAFFESMPLTTQAVLGEGRAEFGRLQSLYGFVRAQGGGAALAGGAQAMLAVCVIGAIAWLWRSRAPFALKAAALAAGALLVTPYLYIYDLCVLAIAVAFLLRFALARGLLAFEAFGLAAATALLLAYPYLKTQVGLVAALIVATLIALRVFTAISRPRAI